MLVQEIIRLKRDGKTLTPEQIDDFITGVNDWSIADGQIAAMTMALLINGMNADELIAFINSLVDSGMVMRWNQENADNSLLGFAVMPGVGDKLEIIAAPLMASCGAVVPVISNRMQYHAGGSLDKLEAVKGFSTRPSISRFRHIIEQAGCGFMSPTEEIVPADSRIQAIRDVTATVNSIPMLVMSMLAKNIASGVKNLTVDIKVGNGSFTETKEKAESCATLIKTAGKALNIDVATTFSPMDYVIGSTVGNSLEISEITKFLTSSASKRDKELEDLVLRVCSFAMTHSGISSDEKMARSSLKKALDSGMAAETFGRMLSAQGVSPDFLNRPDAYLPTAQIVRPVYPEKEGFISGINLRWLGLSLIEMGGGYMYLEHKIDYAVGYSNLCKPGTFVSPQMPIAFVHANDSSIADEATVHLRGAVQISENTLPTTWHF